MSKVFILLLVLLSGCNFTQRDWHVAIAPVNIVAAAVTTVVLHEYAHKITLDYYGAKNVKLYLYPTRDNDGRWQPGRVTYDSLSETKNGVVSIMGPAANMIQSIGARNLLRTGLIPQAFQPTVAALDVTAKGMVYYHGIAGIVRRANTDLSKVDIWIPVVFLVANVAYDIVTFVISDDTIRRYFGVILGVEYYGEKRSKSNEEAFKYRYEHDPNRGF